MLIKNTNPKPVTIPMATRTITLGSGEEQAVTAEEVRDAELREMLQVRAIAIVRPTTDEEEDALRARLAAS